MLARPLFAVLCVGCFGLVLTGCDSSGGNGTADSETFEVTVENVQNNGSGTPILKSGSFVSPEGQSGPGPIVGEDRYEFSFTAGPNELPGTGMRLSFATMFIQSNDLYYAFEPGGLPLFENGSPIGQNGPRDVTSEVNLYDAGTEGDQRPGEGPDQAPRQSSLNTGPSGEGNVTAVNGSNDGFNYPATSDVIKVEVESASDTDGGVRFTVTITNRGTTVNGVPIPLSPGSYAVHWGQNPVAGEDVTYPGHNPGESAGAGIETIAEDGRPDGPFPPDNGMPAGNLVADLTGADGIKSISPFGSGPLLPGNAVSFNVEATPGDRLSLATMYIRSNDLFYATPQEGIALFDDNDQPIEREIEVLLYDAGTEGDQEPGVGLDQAPRQGELNTGPSGEGTVTQVGGQNDGFSYPTTGDIVRVTITPPSQ